MPKICSQNQKAKSNRPKGKNKAPSMMVISVLSNGDIMVQDYSHQDDRQKLVKMLQKMGIKTEAIIDSLCG